MNTSVGDMPPQKRPPITDENKALARHVAGAFGTKPRVQEFLHDTEPLYVDLLIADDAPETDVSSVATIGLSDTLLKWGEGEFPTRIELVGAYNSIFSEFPKVLGSAAFAIMRTGKLCYPGAVMPGYVALYFEKTKLPHLYFTAPFIWSDALQESVFGGKKVNWLLAVPISETERGYLKEFGDQKLEDLLEKTEANIFDLDRDPVI